MVENLTRRWQALDRSARVTLVILVTILAMAIAVRVWLMVSYSPGFLAFPDSGAYALAAAQNIFRDTQRPAGYPLFLRLVHHLSSEASLVIALQHVMGMVTGLLLYKAVRRTGAPAWLGLLPAAIVFFGATGVILEHSLLADAPFTFLQAVGVYGAIRALYEPRLRWPLLAGTAIGISFWVKTDAVASAFVIAVVLLCAAPGGVRHRLISALAVSLVVAGMIVVYVGSQYYFTGYLGYERESAWDLYGKVATFVDCSDFTPPSGTAFLCPSEPPAHRQPPAFYQYAPGSPAVRRFGPEYYAPQYANAVVEKFSVAAIEHEPIAYLGAIMRGLGRYVLPSLGEGNTPEQVREDVSNPAQERAEQPAFTPFYSDSPGYLGPPSAFRPLSTYESYTRVEGPLLILLLLFAIVAPVCLPRRTRWAAAIFTLTALSSILFALAGNGYDARYAYPTFGPLAAGAALGAWGIGSLLLRTFRHRRDRASTDAASSPQAPSPARTS